MVKSLKKVFKNSILKKKPILAFNIQNFDQLDALAISSKINNINVIAQFSVKYFDKLINKESFSYIKKKYKKYKIFFFLDHCNNKNKIIKAIKLRFDGIMYDGSSLKLIDNIKNSNEIFRKIKNKNIVLETEIGIIHNQKDYGIKSKYSPLTYPDLKMFIKKTKFHIIAIAAGNSHGLNKSNIDLEIYKYAIKIDKKIKLVFHGASGNNINYIKKISKLNLVKINYSSILKKEMSKLFSSYNKKFKLFDQIQFENFIKKNLIKFFSNLLKSYK